MRKAGVLTALLTGGVIWGLAATAAVGYPRPAEPLESLCLNRDVVIGKITAIGAPMEIVPKPKPEPGDCHTPDWQMVCKLRVTEVLQEAPASGQAGRKPPRVGQEIAVGIPGQRPGDETPDWVLGGLRNEYVGKKLYPVVVFPPVEWGKSYCVILLRRENGDYFVRTKARVCELANAEWVATVRQALAASWAWSRPADGLQAAIAPGVEWRKAKEMDTDALAVALRNVSNRTLTLNARTKDRFLRMRASDPNGRRVEADPPKLFRLREPYDDLPTVSLAPGEAILTGCWGMDRVGLYLDWLPPGRWTVQASYISDRKADKVDLWAGQVWSQPFPLRHGPPATNPTTSPAGDAKRSP